VTNAPKSQAAVGRALAEAGLKHTFLGLTDDFGPMWQVGFDLEGGGSAQIVLTLNDHFLIASHVGPTVPPESLAYRALLEINGTLALAKLGLNATDHLTVTATVALDDVDALHVRQLFGAMLTAIDEARRAPARATEIAKRASVR
jgi:hypothetical protein